MRSTCLASTATPASSRNRSRLSAKLTRAAVRPIIRVTAGDSDVSSTGARGRAGRPRVTGGTVKVRARQRQRAQHALKRLGAPPRVPGPVATRARDRAGLVRGVRVDPRLDRARGNAQRGPPDGNLQGLEIPSVGGAGVYERLEFSRNLRLERRPEPPFSAGAPRCRRPARVPHRRAARRPPSTTRWHPGTAGRLRSGDARSRPPRRGSTASASSATARVRLK